MRGWPWTGRPELVVGEFGPRLWRRPVRIPLADVRSHVQVSGVTGMGKTRFLANLFLELLGHGQAATLLDPHGDAARLVLDELIARGDYDDDQLIERVIYLDLPAASRHGRGVPYNVLRQPHLDPHTVARSVLEALRRAWPSLDQGQAPMFENVVLAGTFVLLVHDLPLTRLHELLIHDRWREQLLERIDDPAVVGFFRDRWARWGRERPLLIESCLRRVFLLAFSPVLRHSLGQTENLLNLRRLMDQGRSLIVNLAVDDPDARRLLGCLLTVGFEQAALSRASAPAVGRSHVLLLDEFSEFAGQSSEAVSRMLALCRKFGLSLVLAHQTWTQTTAQLQGALQNVGTMVTFRQGRSDASIPCWSSMTSLSGPAVDPIRSTVHSPSSGKRTGSRHCRT